MKKDNGIRSVDKVITSIGVKLATKYLIRKHSDPGESLEDTILRVIHRWEHLESENEKLMGLLRENDLLPQNLLMEGHDQRTTDSILFEGDIDIHFSYCIPAFEGPIENGYRMDIMIEKVIQDGKTRSFEDFDLPYKDIFFIQFRMLERIINTHFDRGFRIDERVNFLDPYYWKKVFNRVGLPESSYVNDALSIISEYESG